MQTLQQRRANTPTDDKEPQGDDSWTTESRQQRRAPRETFQERKVEKKKASGSS